jgi:hypothetical protein
MATSDDEMERSAAGGTGKGNHSNGNQHPSDNPIPNGDHTQLLPGEIAVKGDQESTSRHGKSQGQGDRDRQVRDTWMRRSRHRPPGGVQARRAQVPSPPHDPLHRSTTAVHVQHRNAGDGNKAANHGQ